MQHTQEYRGTGESADLAREGRPTPAQAPTQAPAQALERRRKNPMVAGILSLLPGLGQVYIGYYRRGFTHLLVTAATMSVLSSHPPRGLEPLLGMFVAFFWLYNIVDAARLASLYNDALAGIGPEDLRRELVLLGRRGTIGGGIVLMAASLLFLLHTVFGLSLDWLRQWWPAVPLGYGAYLLLQGLREKKNAA